MKRLTILRHAKSSWDDPALDDFDRPLNARSRKAALRIGREIRQRGLKIDLVLSSPSARTRETINGVKQEYDFAAPIEFVPKLYLASDVVLLDCVRMLDEACTAPLIVGHNPGLEQLLAELTVEDRNGLRANIVGKFPTGALAVVELSAERWRDVGWGSGKVVNLILPRELD